MQVCSLCGKEKNESEFYKNKNRKEGIYNHYRK